MEHAIRVLVVDDEVLVRSSVLKVLKRDNIFADEAEDGYKAIEKVKTNEYDIIVSDVRMPGIDGIETIKRIKEIVPGIKTIVMTGFASENTPIEAIRIGVNDYIYKPFELEEFRHCIKRNVNMINLEKENEKLENENIKSQKLAAIGSMTNTIVHDVKNALTTITGFTKLIKKNESNSVKIEEYSEIILYETNSILMKLQEILEFSKGNVEMYFEEVDLKDFFDEILVESNNLMNLNSIKREAYFDEKLDGYRTKIDKKRMGQVFFNLFSNSKDALVEKYDKQISLNFSFANNFLVIKVRDNGKGIDSENFGKIFELFATFEKDHGTGIGLAIVKQIIEKSGGEISVDSQFGEWTEFKITMPIFM